MTSLLHLDASANRSGESISRQLSFLFARTWQTEHGLAGYRYHDLATDPVPPLDTAYCELGRRVGGHGLVPARTLIGSTAEGRACELTRPLVADVLAADTVLIGAPMYNYSVPAALKAWLDRLNFPGAFSGGLLRDTSVVVISVRGGAYRPGAPDFQRPYLRHYFDRLHVGSVRFVSVEHTLSELVPHLAGQRRAAADSLAAARAEVVSAAGQALS